ncbi:zinc finger (c3hc4 ring finger) domain-containing protein [Cyclospora cayetanensis]|uniref:Zinc finger (C3hc4 ring finger) domain-containing protein n=1 Tax=Cyclospora cayetanensis TaxID=88456 RepID=A0A1D3CZR5_9EIME|nr:zinc finger (c3hc4 ring finger) domain-containing protein [Cyclospora cayetanensis]
MTPYPRNFDMNTASTPMKPAFRHPRMRLPTAKFHILSAKLFSIEIASESQATIKLISAFWCTAFGTPSISSFQSTEQSSKANDKKMVLSGFTLNDAILLFAFFYSSSDVFVEWDSFASCAKPIHYWLLGSYVALIAFRLSHYLGQYLSDDGDEDFILYRQRGPPFWVNVLILGVLFPCFFGWTILGTFWFLEVRDKTPYCLPRESHPWFFAFWLGLCYIWILIYIIFIGIAAVFEYRARRIEADLRILQNEDMIRRQHAWRAAGLKHLSESIAHQLQSPPADSSFRNTPRQQKGRVALIDICLKRQIPAKGYAMRKTASSGAYGHRQRKSIAFGRCLKITAGASFQPSSDR